MSYGFQCFRISSIVKQVKPKVICWNSESHQGWEPVRTTATNKPHNVCFTACFLATGLVRTRSYLSVFIGISLWNTNSSVTQSILTSSSNYLLYGLDLPLRFLTFTSFIFFVASQGSGSVAHVPICSLSVSLSLSIWSSCSWTINVRLLASRMKTVYQKVACTTLKILGHLTKVIIYIFLC